MSISRRVAVSASATLALALGTAGTAFAATDPQTLQRSAQGTTSACTFTALSKPVTSPLVIEVKATPGQHCQVSLASYLTHGATWQTSGKQSLYDWSGVDLKDGQTGTLTTKVPATGCFVQIDLYKGLTKFDGIHAPLPAGPNQAVIGNLKLATWSGGTHVCSAATPSPTPTTASPTPSPTPTPSPVVSATAVALTSPSPSSSPSTTLAETGSSGTATLAGVAAALVAGGGATVFFLRRKKSSAHS